MDPMSDVLAGMRVRSFDYARLEAHAPWGITFKKHSASLGMILEGQCWLSIERVSEPVLLRAGDCFLIVHGDAHALRATREAATRPFSKIFKPQSRVAQISGPGAAAVVVGGWFRFDPLSSRPLTKVLPPLIHIPAANSAVRGLDTTLQCLADETQVVAPGSEIVVNRLAEVLFIQMIRAFVASELDGRPGWLRALGNRQIGTALHLIHGDISRNWSVGELARAAGVSRSAFAHRFRALVGEAPMEYLTNLRMFKAGEMLRGSQLGLAEIARAVGYDSDAAFCHAFKRVSGTTAGEFRRTGLRERPQGESFAAIPQTRR
jgi:AraC-like DNA-binding protein